MQIQLESASAREQRHREWHRWYAWHPVRIGERIHWLETVERRGEMDGEGWTAEWKWHYRLSAQDREEG